MTKRDPGFVGLEPAPGLLSIPDVIPVINKAAGITTYWNITGTDITMEIYVKYKNPVPKESIRGRKAYPTGVKRWP